MHNLDCALYRSHNPIGPFIVNQTSDGKKTAALGASGAGNRPKKKRVGSAQIEGENAIGSGLRSLYQEVIKEPLPDDILALLDKLGSLDSTDE
jgi:Anti-sigma factor NepR